MSGQITHGKILEHMNILGQIKPGYTLSSTSMTVVPHNEWGTAFWRSYKGETRADTIALVRKLLIDAVALYEDNSDDGVLRGSIVNALTGVKALEETYKGDAATVEEIANLVKAISAMVEKVHLVENDESLEEQFEEQLEEQIEEDEEQQLQQYLSQFDSFEPVASSSDDETPEFEAREIVIDFSELENSAEESGDEQIQFGELVAALGQKIRTPEVEEKSFSHSSEERAESYFEEVVSSSDRDVRETSTDGAVSGSVPSWSSEADMHVSEYADLITKLLEDISGQAVKFMEDVFDRSEDAGVEIAAEIKLLAQATSDMVKDAAEQTLHDIDNYESKKCASHRSSRLSRDHEQSGTSTKSDSTTSEPRTCVESQVFGVCCGFDIESQQWLLDSDPSFFCHTIRKSDPMLTVLGLASLCKEWVSSP